MNTTIKREIPEFSLEQRAYLESFFGTLVETLDNVQSSLKLTNESLIDSHAEQNKNITVWDIHNSLSLINDTLNPINTELFELSSGVDYMLSDINHKGKTPFWNKIEDNYELCLKSVKKSEAYKIEFKKAKLKNGA